MAQTTEQKLNIVISAKDKATKAFKDLSKSALVATASITALSAVSLKLATDAARGIDLERGFVRNFKTDVEDGLNVLRTASKGTIADIDLMATSNRAALLGVSDNVEDLSAVMQTARLRGMEMGMGYHASVQRSCYWYRTWFTIDS